VGIYRNNGEGIYTNPNGEEVMVSPITVGIDLRGQPDVVLVINEDFKVVKSINPPGGDVDMVQVFNVYELPEGSRVVTFNGYRVTDGTYRIVYKDPAKEVRAFFSLGAEILAGTAEIASSYIPTRLGASRSNGIHAKKTGWYAIYALIDTNIGNSSYLVLKSPNKEPVTIGLGHGPYIYFPSIALIKGDIISLHTDGAVRNVRFKCVFLCD